MAIQGRLLDKISDSPSSVTDWELAVNNLSYLYKGHINLGMTDWIRNNTVIPNVVGGSSIEVEGNMITFPEDTEIDYMGEDFGYLVIDIGNTVNAIPRMTTNRPVWNQLKGGFYDGEGRRATGHFFRWDNQDFAYDKGSFSSPNTPHGDTMWKDVDNRLYFSQTSYDLISTAETWSIGSGATYMPSVGMYMVATNSYPYNLFDGTAVVVQIYDGSSWVGDYRDAPPTGVLLCDGVNVRLKNNMSDSTSFIVRRIF